MVCSCQPGFVIRDVNSRSQDSTCRDDFDQFGHFIRSKVRQSESRRSLRQKEARYACVRAWRPICKSRNQLEGPHRQPFTPRLEAIGIPEREQRRQPRLSIRNKEHACLKAFSMQVSPLQELRDV